MPDNSKPLAAAKRVYAEHLDRSVMARYYLKCEMGRVITSQSATVTKAIDKSVDEMNDFDTFRFLESLSWTYRLNPVFSYITDEGLDWHEVELPIDKLVLSGVKPAFDRIAISKKIGRSPLKMANWLAAHFDSSDGSEPELNEFRPTGRPIRHRLIMVRQTGKGLEMVDGTHRLLAMVMSGTKTVDAYVAVPNGKRRRSMVGDGSFYQLAHLYYRFRKPEQREAILAVTEMLAKTSTNGTNAITTYWIKNQLSPVMKNAGAALLDRLRR